LRDRSTARNVLSPRRAAVGGSKEEDMKRLMNMVRGFVYNVEGQDLTEYALLVALIALAAVGAVTAAGGQINSIFNQITSQIKVPAA
jgi:Flp pilus assembly pilin Flp